jgi:hypothetical protein
MEQTTKEQITPPQENYAFGQKITPVAIYWMLITLGVINIVEFLCLIGINFKVSALCGYFHISH